MKPASLSLATTAATVSSSSSSCLACASRIVRPLRDRLGRERLAALDDRSVRAAREPRVLLVADADRDERRLLELEREVGLAACGLPRSAAIARAMRITSSALSLRLCAFSVLSARMRNAISGSGMTSAMIDFAPSALQRGEAVHAVRREASRRRVDRDHRIEEPADLRDHGREPRRRASSTARAGTASARPCRAAARRARPSGRRAARGRLASTWPPSFCDAAGDRAHGLRALAARDLAGGQTYGRGVLGALLFSRLRGRLLGWHGIVKIDPWPRRSQGHAR